MAATSATWRKSSYSNGGQQGSCVEVARYPLGSVAVRDSKDPRGPRLIFTAADWRAFTRHVKAGRDGLT
jgi:Domain of unknown function (DUF397)